MDKVTDYLSKLTPIERKNSPRCFYFQGDFSLLEAGRRVSVVGSRKISEKGLEQTNIFVKKLIELNICIVSGLAEGVDTAAHLAAINNYGKTIAVIGTPLNEFYPRRNKALQLEIAKNHLLVSQFQENHPITPKNFPMRNRTMALISDATLIIEASEKSGTKHQGWEALRLGRELFINQDLITNNISWAKEMLKYGAQTINIDNANALLQDTPFLTTKEYYVL